MNTKSNVFTRGSATRENTTFGVHSVKKNQSYTEKVKYPLFIPSSEFNAYLKQIKVVLSTVKKYRIFSLVTNTIYIFHCSKQRHFRQFRAKFLPEKVRNALFESDVTLRMYARQIKLMKPHLYVTFELT